MVIRFKACCSWFPADEVHCRNARFVERHMVGRAALIQDQFRRRADPFACRFCGFRHDVRLAVERVHVNRRGIVPRGSDHIHIEVAGASRHFTFGQFTDIMARAEEADFFSADKDKAHFLIDRVALQDARDLERDRGSGCVIACTGRKRHAVVMCADVDDAVTAAFFRRARRDDVFGCRAFKRLNRQGDRSVRRQDIRLQRFAARLGDSADRDAHFIAAERWIKWARLVDIVIDQDAGSSCSFGILYFFRKGEAAALDQGDFPRRLGIEISRITEPRII